MAKKVIALIGAGGKTTALGLLARQSKLRPVLVTTTTHIFPAEGIPCLMDPREDALLAALQEHPILCAGSSAREGKLGILPAGLLQAAMAAAELVVYEGDGSKRLPLKLHNASEPVILPETTHCLILAGLSALGKPMHKAIHRFSLNPGWSPDAIVDVETLIHCVMETAASSGLPHSRIKVFLNQADLLGNPTAAMEAAVLLRLQGLDTRFGSLQGDPSFLYDWLDQ